MLKKIVSVFAVGSLAYFFRWYYIGRRKYDSLRIFDKDVIVITGAYSGIGTPVARDLAKRNTYLILGCKDIKKGNRFKRKLIIESGNKDIFVEAIDLASFESISRFADRVLALNKPVYALLNNAGVFFTQPHITKDGFEYTFQVNYLGQFLLTNLLLPALRKYPGNSRIVNMSSRAHFNIHEFPNLDLHLKYEDNFKNRFEAYQYSKLCLVMFSHKLSTLLERSSTTVHCVDPGNTETNIYRTFPPLSNLFLFYLQKPIRFFVVKTPKEGAQGSLYALLSEKSPRFYIKDIFKENEEKEVNPLVFDPILKDTIWKISRKSCSGM